MLFVFIEIIFERIKIVFLNLVEKNCLCIFRGVVFCEKSIYIYLDRYHV